MAVATGTAMLGSAVLGGIGSAASGRSQRRAQDKQNALSAAEAEKDRQHEMAMFDKQRKVYADAASSWKKYDFGGMKLPPLISRAEAPAAPQGPVAPMSGARGLLPNEEFMR